MAVSLTPRDEDLLDTLVRCVRVLSLAQVTRTWWPTGRDHASTADRRLQSLAADGWLTYERLWARPEVPLRAPLFTWQPGENPPDCRELARTTLTRFTAPAQLTPCAVATRRAGERFGARGGRTPRETEVTHDLHLAEVYLLMRAELPTRARSFRSEDAAPMPESGEKRPDAFVVDGRHATAIEFAGAYDHVKLQSFHESCEARALPYEIW